MLLPLIKDSVTDALPMAVPLDHEKTRPFAVMPARVNETVSTSNPLLFIASPPPPPSIPHEPMGCLAKRLPSWVVHPSEPVVPVYTLSLFRRLPDELYTQDRKSTR